MLEGRDFKRMFITYRALLAKRQGKGFSEVEVTSILRQILSQLTKLHDLKQAHGAISLDTVVHDSERMHIVLLPDNWMNHPIYLAPEVAKNRQATPAADIYALGVFVIVLLTGLSPEELKTADNEWNWEDRCDVSNRFIQMLNMALFDAYEFRYVNAGQMLRSLQPLLSATQRKPESSFPISTQTATKPRILPPPDLSLTQFPKPPLPPSELNVPDSPKETLTDSFNLETVEAFDFGSNDLRKTSDLKADLPDSPIYRKTGFSKDTSKKNAKSRVRIFILIISGIGIIAIAVIASYFYVQSRSAGNANKNIQASNTATQSVSAESEKERIEREKKVEQKTNQLLKSAKAKYQNTGSLIEAKTILQGIPANSPMRPAADRLINQWQEETKKNNELIKKAETAIANGNWQQAIDSVQNVSPNPYWQQRSKKILEDANKKIIETSPVAVPIPAVTPVSDATQEPSAPIQELPPLSSPAPPQEPEAKDAPPPPRAAN